MGVKCIRNTAKYLMEGKYKQFVEAFPQDRLARVSAAKIVADIFASVKRKYSYRPSIGGLSYTKRRHTNVLRSYTVTEFAEFDVIQMEDTFRLGKIGHSRVLSVVLGEDDSGNWIEILNATALYEDVIRGRLGCGKTYSNELDNEKYRIQGDVNLTRLNLINNVASVVNGIPTKLGEWFVRHPKYFDDAENIIQSRSRDFVRVEESLVDELQEVFNESYSDYLKFTGANNTWREYDFQNHNILLYNATFPRINNEGGYMFEVPNGGGKLKIKSPHHNTVEIELPTGMYILTKSGGMSVEGVRMFAKDYICPIYHSWE